MIVAGNVLSLDLATRLGWASGTFDSMPIFGAHQLTSYGEDTGRYLADFDDWLQATLDFEQPELVIYEAPSVFAKSNPVTQEKLYSLAGHTQLVCHRRGIRRKSANPSQVKKHWTGKGNAKKPEMVDFARRYGFRTTDDNEADALAVWWWCVECYGTDEQRERFRQKRFEVRMGVNPSATA